MLKLENDLSDICLVPFPENLLTSILGEGFPPIEKLETWSVLGCIQCLNINDREIFSFLCNPSIHTFLCTCLYIYNYCYSVGKVLYSIKFSIHFFRLKILGFVYWLCSCHSGLAVELKPLENKLMESGSWFWNYKLIGKHVQLELVEL